MEEKNLDMIMRDWRYLVKREWTLLTWIELYLIELVKNRFVGPQQKDSVLRLTREALKCPWVAHLPNNHGAFPHLFRA